MTSFDAYTLLFDKRAFVRLPICAQNLCEPNLLEAGEI